VVRTPVPPQAGRVLCDDVSCLKPPKDKQQGLKVKLKKKKKYYTLPKTDTPHATLINNWIDKNTRKR
jgi:hypothetical protein